MRQPTIISNSSGSESILVAVFVVVVVVMVLLLSQLEERAKDESHWQAINERAQQQQ